jgi:RNA polymerase-binding transcription factor DksA
MAAKSPATKAPKGNVTPSKKSGGTAKKPSGSPKTTSSKTSPSKTSPSKTTPSKTTKSAPPKATKSASRTTSAKVTKSVAKTPAKAVKAAAPVVKQAVAKKPVAKKPVAKKPVAKKAVAEKRSAATPKQPTKQAPAQPIKQTSKPPVKATKSSPANKPLPTAVPTRSARAAAPIEPSLQSGLDSIPKPKFNKEGLGYTKDFDLAFIKVQYDMLQQERIHLTGQAKRLEAEAHQMIEEAEMGDVQFDDEGGEGDTMVVERERDLALSAQARDAVDEIDAALVRIAEGTYGYSVMSGRPIPKERLEAIPWSSVLVEEKVGGIGRR